ncbi:hypothetical protein GCM10029978_010750 [Actinoallomurus acanthiterrae]
MPPLSMGSLRSSITLAVRCAIMALEMRGACERCAATLDQNGLAYICSYECSYCGSCTRLLAHKCPNCAGELVRRPTRI